jgi:hypothetical protein
MTVERSDGSRVLVYRDGSPVIENDGRPRTVRLDDLDPASQRIVQALIAAGDHTDDARSEQPAEAKEPRPPRGSAGQP